ITQISGALTVCSLCQSCCHTSPIPTWRRICLWRRIGLYVRMIGEEPRPITDEQQIEPALESAPDITKSKTEIAAVIGLVVALLVSALLFFAPVISSYIPLLGGI